MTSPDHVLAAAKRAARNRKAADRDLEFRAGLSGLPQPQREFRFHPTRRWRFDYAWPEHKVALEVEGGVWTAGRHTRAAGFLKDVEKYNEAELLGWTVLRCVPKTLCSIGTLEMLDRALR